MIRVKVGGVTHMFPDDFTDAEIAKALKAPGGNDNPLNWGKNAGAKSVLTSLRDETVNTIPAAAGFFGGVYGGVPGMTIAGGAGRGVRDLAARALHMPDAPTNWTDARHNMENEAATQGILGLVGAAGGKGVKWVGGRMIDASLKPAKPLQMNYPDVNLREAAQEAGPVVRITQEGEEAVGDMAVASSDKLNALLAKRSAAGARVTSKDFSPEMDALRGRTANSMSADDQTYIDGLINEFHAEFAKRGVVSQIPASQKPASPGQFTQTTGEEDLLTLRGIRQSADRKAADLFRTQETGKGQDPTLELQFQQAKGAAARRLLRSQSPEVQRIDAKTQRLMALTQAIKESRMAELSGAGQPGTLKDFISAVASRDALMRGGRVLSGPNTYDTLRLLMPAAASRMLSAHHRN